MRRGTRWQLAIAQHPMYLIIREDDEAAERTPPWGSPTIELYIERIERNLDGLDRYPDLKLGYEWSGTELELLAEDSPDTLERLRSYARRGRLGLYNGTYAQPHLQVLSAEANFRQFEAGGHAYNEQLGVHVTTYAHQEVSVHDQVPQLLRAFGFETAVLPGFRSTLTWIRGGESNLHGVRGARQLNGREFTMWRGLDGSQIPLLLHQPIPRDRTFRDTLVHEAVMGALGAPRLMIDMPDMIDVDDAWLAERSEAEFVLLEPAIRERISQAPPQGSARLTTSWSYLEGIQVEALSRSIQGAEAALLAADAVQSVAMATASHVPHSLDALWRQVLTSQHHDVFCFSAPGLRRRALDWLAEAQQQAVSVGQESAGAVASQVEGSGDGDVMVFGVTPHRVQAIVQADLTDDAGDTVPGLVDGDGRPVTAELDVGRDGSRQLRFIADLDGLGWRTFRRVPAAAKASTQQQAEPVALDGPLVFDNARYKAVIDCDGTFVSLIPAGGTELLDPERGPAHRLTATDSSDLATRDESDDQRRARLAASIPARGPALVWQQVEPATARRGPLGLRFLARGRLSDTVSVDVEIDLYESLARIEMRHRFTFDNASLGTYFDDDSKLLLHWPFRQIDAATHDIPFGVVDATPEQSLFPTTWLDVRVANAGVLLMHGGTPRHWIVDNEVVRLLGWGEDTDAIGNRLGNWRWLKRFDQRLRGTHVVGSAVEVHPATWGPDELIAAARSYSCRPLVHAVRGRGRGRLPHDLTLAALPAGGPHATSVQPDDGRVSVRVHAGPRRTSARGPSGTAIGATHYRSLAGRRLSVLRPWQIAQLVVQRAAHQLEDEQ